MTATGRPRKVYGMHELAERLGVDRNLLSKWRVRNKLPPPDEMLAATPVWFAETIDRWLGEG